VVPQEIRRNKEGDHMISSEDDLLISRALAAGWTAQVSEIRIPSEKFCAAWVYTWAPPGDGEEPHEVWVSPRDGLRLTIDDFLRGEFREIENDAPADYDLERTLIDVLISVENDLRWIVDSDSRERAYEIFSTAYKALGAEMPRTVTRRLDSPALHGSTPKTGL
jgi:hypothetical protein